MSATPRWRGLYQAIARGAAVCAAAALVIGPGAGLSAAHDSVINATPGVDSTVTEFPREITLEFSGEPRDTFNTLAVSRAEGDDREVLFSGEPTLDGRFVSIAVPDDVQPGDGTYVVGFQITSSDGHATRGYTTFTVAGSAHESASEAAGGSSSLMNSAESAGTESSQNSSSLAMKTPVVIVITLGAMLVVATLIALAVHRQRSAVQGGWAGRNAPEE